MPSHEKYALDLKQTLVDLATYRHADRVAGGKPDPLIVHTAYAQDNEIYHEGKIVTLDEDRYREAKVSTPNDLVNKFGLVYIPGSSLLLHRKLADVLIDASIDMRDRWQQFTVMMDGLRTCDSGTLMQENRPDLVAAKLLAPAGTSAHNRALAVDSKLFELIHPVQHLPLKVTLPMLKEADEKGHLDDLDMVTSNRFYAIDTYEPAYRNRLNRLQAWQRAAVKNKLPVASLIAEFWDDRVTGSPADMWRVLTCRAMCIGVDGNPKSNPLLNTLKTKLSMLHEQHDKGLLNDDTFTGSAQSATEITWNQLFTHEQKQQLEELLGHGGGRAPALTDYIFHEWIENIYDRDLQAAGFEAQSLQPGTGMDSNAAPKHNRV